MWYAMLINCLGAHQDTCYSFRWADCWIHSQRVSSFLQNFGTCACNTASERSSSDMSEVVKDFCGKGIETAAEPTLGKRPI